MPYQINLLNPALRPQKIPFSARQIAGTLLVLCAALPVVAVVLHGHESALMAEADTLSAQLRERQQEVTVLEAKLARHKPDPALEAEIAALGQQIDVHEQSLQALTRFFDSQGQGFSERLRGLARQRQDGLWLTRVNFSGQDILLEGATLHPERLPAWLRLLGQEPSFRERSFQSVEVRPPASEGVTTREGVRPAALTRDDASPGSAPTPWYTFTLTSRFASQEQP